MSSYCPIRDGYAIGLVLYHPEEGIIRRVSVMVDLGFKVYVFDNSPFDSVYSRIIQDSPNITYLTAGKNVGIGYSLSTLCATAYTHGYPHLLFLDQDTGISYQTLEFIETFSQSLSSEIRQQYAALVFNGQPGPDHSVREVRLAISSGSLFNLPVLKQIGWHNVTYFVDCVDYEFCVRARRGGFKIGLIKNTPDFDHITEQPDRAIEILGKLVLVRRYPARRVKDAIGAYIKLIIGGLFNNSLGDTIILVKSASIYLVNQIISRLITEKNK